MRSKEDRPTCEPTSEHRPTCEPIADHDARIRGVAAGQHGVASRRQLVRAGVPGFVVDHRVRTGELRRVHQGVYLVGPIAGPLARETAAVLSCGPRSALSHRSAASLWGLMPELPPHAPVEVSGPPTLQGRRAGVRLHRVRSLLPGEIVERTRLPVTTPERTLLDLAAAAHPRLLRRLLDVAQRTRRVTPDSMRETLRRHRGRRGCPALETALDTLGDPDAVRSEAEARFLELLDRVDLPRPLVNAMAEGMEVDFLWRSQRLVVEIDGFEHHSGRAAFERDRARDSRLVAAGLRVLRFSWRHLTTEPETVLVRVAQALVRGGRHGGGGH